MFTTGRRELNLNVSVWGKYVHLVKKKMLSNKLKNLLVPKKFGENLYFIRQGQIYTWKDLKLQNGQCIRFRIRLRCFVLESKSVKNAMGIRHFLFEILSAFKRCWIYGLSFQFSSAKKKQRRLELFWVLWSFSKTIQ